MWRYGGDMDLPSRVVHEAVADAGVTHLHHANTVLTACHFIREGSLLSRGSVERRGLAQTPQASDALDKRYSVWYDVFLDSVDIHRRASRRNLYGPVTFVLRVDVLRRGRTGKVWVTRDNPTKWKGVPANKRWLQSKKDLRDGFQRGTFGQMIVLRHCGGELPLEPYLDHIIVDHPRRTDQGGRGLYSVAVGALRSAMTDSGLDVPLKRRDCARSCACKDQYARLEAKAAKSLFFPVLSG